jgi:hypothetical protein
VAAVAHLQSPEPVEANGVMNPTDPTYWPACPDCETAWVLRRGLSISKGWTWVWQCDCKHKRAEPVFVGENGPLERADDGTYVVPK